MNNGFTKVTHVDHTKSEVFLNGLAAWWRGVSNQRRLRRLSRKNIEGSNIKSSDLRAGGGRRK